MTKPTTTTSSRIAFCSAARISTGMVHQYWSTGAGMTSAVMPSSRPAAYRAKPGQSDDGSKSHAPENVAAATLARDAQPTQRRWLVRVEAQQVERKHDRYECEADTQHLQGEVEPFAITTGSVERRRRVAYAFASQLNESGSGGHRPPTGRATARGRSRVQRETVAWWAESQSTDQRSFVANVSHVLTLPLS